jgi:hypothetical protein
MLNLLETLETIYDPRPENPPLDASKSINCPTRKESFPNCFRFYEDSHRT